MKEKLFQLLIKKAGWQNNHGDQSCCRTKFIRKKILVIDLDPQGNATTGLGLSNLENSEKSIYSVLNGTKKISDVIEKTNFKNVDLITSNVDLSGLEVETAGDNRRAFILKEEIMAYLKILEEYIVTY